MSSPRKKQSSNPSKKNKSLLTSTDFGSWPLHSSCLSLLCADLYVKTFVPTHWMAYSACTHGHSLSSFTEKQSLAAFYTDTSFFLQCHLFTELCKHPQTRVAGGICQPTKDSGLTKRSSVRGIFSEGSKPSTNPLLQPRENPGISLG